MSLYSWIFGTEPNALEESQAEAIRVNNAARAARAAADQATLDNLTSITDERLNRNRDFTGQYSFSEDFATGFRNDLSSAASYPFKLVPWWFWVVAAGSVFLYFGGAEMIKKKLK